MSTTQRKSWREESSYYQALELYPVLKPKFYIDKLNIGGKVYAVDNVYFIQYPELMPEQIFAPTKSGIKAFYSKYNIHP